MNKILILGAGGYLGSKLTWKFLQNGHDVIAVDNLLYNQGHLVANIFNHPHCQFFKLDIEEVDNKIISECDVIYPLAALVGMPICAKNKQECYRVNTTALIGLLNKTSKNQRIIFPNTNSGYGTTTGGICTEETPLNSISDYGRSKEMAERAIMDIRPTHSTVLRLATVYGPSFRPRIDLLVNYFIFNAINNPSLDIFEGDFYRNFIHIDDVIDAFYELRFDGFTFGQIYNLGCDADNMKKSALINNIKSWFPELKINQINKSDPDQRNYIVSSEKLASHFQAKRRIFNELNKLIPFFKLIDNNIDITKYMRNDL